MFFTGKIFFLILLFSFILEEVYDRHRQRLGDHFQRFLGIKPSAVFQLVDISLRQAAFQGKRLLGQSFSCSDSSDVVANDIFSFHEQMILQPVIINKCRQQYFFDSNIAWCYGSLGKINLLAFELNEATRWKGKR